MNLTLDLRGMPSVVAALREELARLLRQQADLEIQLAVADRLREVADAFEAGLTLSESRAIGDGPVAGEG